jgi:hypothetical protein
LESEGTGKKKMAWVNCTSWQLEKVIELDYRRRMGHVKSLARILEWQKRPLDENNEIIKQMLEHEPRSEWRDRMIKLIEEEKRKNPKNAEQEQQKDAQEREKWK